MKWSESIDIDRAATEVLRAVADETELLQWSAWPEATGYTCAIEGDGRSLGSAIVFTDAKGVLRGRQVLHAVGQNSVEYRLRNRGPFGREMTPQVRYRCSDLGDARARVNLDFEAEAPLPPGVRNLVEAVLGRRVRRLHIKDLEQLKAHVESRTPR